LQSWCVVVIINVGHIGDEAFNNVGGQQIVADPTIR